MNKKIRIAVLVSGGGTNLQSLIDSQKNGVITSGEIVLVVSNNPQAYALKRAEKAQIPREVITKSASSLQFENDLLAVLKKYNIDMIILAGFMSILSSHFISHYPNRIINIHPSLIPSFCGKGMYGIHVHEAALKYGVKISGATVHFVNEIPDGGKIILQKAVKIYKNDTPQILQQRIMKQAEWIILPKAAQIVAKSLLES